MEDDTPQPHHTALQDPPLESALDALLSDYLDRLDVLSRAYSPEGYIVDAGPSTSNCASSSTSTSNEAHCLKLHDEAVERRNLVGLFECGLQVGSSTGTGNDQDTQQKERRDLVSLPSILEFNQEEQEIWRRWRPEVDETVLVYLSPVRGYWPGKIIDLGYFHNSALPRISRQRMFAVRIYPAKQNPIIAIKSHLVPLHLRPQPPRNAPSTLSKAYRTAASSLLYDIEALGLELSNRSYWGMGMKTDLRPANDRKPPMLAEKIERERFMLVINGKSWFDWKDWIEEQSRLELQQQRRRGGGPDGRDDDPEALKREATGILNDLESKGYPVFSSAPAPIPAAISPMKIARDSSPSTHTRPPSTLTNPTRSDLKRSRRRLTEALEDPIIGPHLSRLSLGDVCRALLPASTSSSTSSSRKESSRKERTDKKRMQEMTDQFSGLAPDNNNGMDVIDDQIRLEALDHVLGKKRKRGGGPDEDVSMRFVTPLTGQSIEDEEEGWSVVKRNRHR